MSFPSFTQVLCMTRCVQFDHNRILVILVQKIHRQKEYCLSVAQTLTSRYESRTDDGMQIDCTSDNISVLEEVALIITLSCNEGSMRLRPECPWRARKYTIVPDSSVQYWWYLFLFPHPPAMFFFLFSSDQWWQCRKCFWRLSLILQNSIAPSFSRGRLPWRRRWINFFDTA